MDMNAPFFGHGFFGDTAGLLFGFTLGVAFGFVLERGGFGSARKLAAQFYLTDLTVFKTMFTAIITAMTGLFVLSEAGFVDITMVYVSPTYLVPQTVGGIIFGVGFVMGGYCPGTACVATSTGRMDGIVHIVGMSAGILLFGEMFPLFKSFYYETSMGSATLPRLLNIPEGLVIILIVILAGLGFVISERIEKRVHGIPRSDATSGGPGVMPDSDAVSR
jgi:uncharacterized membrane protein YedE/YeeE